MPAHNALLSREDLRDYQVYAVERIKRQRYLALWLDMGLGKTISCLTAVRDLLDEFTIRKVLVVAPLYVAENTWPDEIREWQHTRSLTYSVITGSPEDREQAVSAEAEIYIINRENIPWLWGRWKEKWPYDMVIWDESSGLKNHATRNKPTKKAMAQWASEVEFAAWVRQILDFDAPGKETRLSRKEANDLACDPRKVQKPTPNLTRFGCICKARPFISRFVELTGTPSPNGLTDLWSQIYVLDGGRRLGRNITAFRKRWFERAYDGFSYQPRYGAQEEIMGLLQDIAVSMRSEDYLELPDRVDNIIEIKLADRVMAEYKRLEADRVLDEHDIEAVNKGVLTGKLLQLANGSVYNTERVAVGFHKQKLEALERIVEEANGEPILVAYSYEFDLQAILKKFPKARTLDTPNVVKDWNAGKIPMLVVHPASAGHGLNLQHGGHIGVWYGLNWSLELYQQFNKRLHRSGQKHAVVLHHLIAQGTIDEVVLEAMRRKGALQSDVTSAVRARVERILRTAA